jgi:hypothetical protein
VTHCGPPFFYFSGLTGTGFASGNIVLKRPVPGGDCGPHHQLIFIMIRDDIGWLLENPKKHLTAFTFACIYAFACI